MAYKSTRPGIIIAEAVKERVTVPQLLGYYGVKVGRGRRCACPIHHGKNLNMAISDRSYKCYKCGSSGTVIDLQMALSGHGFKEALSDLDSMFHLGLASHKPSDIIRSEMILFERKGRQRIEAANLAWNRKQYDILVQIRRMRDRAGKDCTELDAALDDLLAFDEKTRIPSAATIADATGCNEEMVVMMIAGLATDDGGGTAPPGVYCHDI